MKSIGGSNLRAIPVAPGAEQTDSAPDTSQSDAQSVNQGVDDLMNLPEAPKAMPVPVGQPQSSAVHQDDDELNSLPDAGGRLGHVYDAVSQGDPANVAKVLDTSNKLGADPGMVAGSLKDAEKAANGPDQNFFQAIEDKFPGTTKFLQVPQNMAVAHDDLPNVAQTEDLINKVKDAFSSEKNALASGSLQEELSFLRNQQMNGQTTPQTDSFRLGGMVASQMGAPTTNVVDRANWVQSKLDEISKSRPGADQSWIKRGIYGATEFLPQIAGGAMTGLKYAAPAAAVAAVAGAETGPGDIPIALTAAGAGFTTGEAEYNFRLMSGMAYDNLLKVRDIKKQPLPDNVMRIAATATGAVGAGLSFVKLGALLESVPGGKSFIEQFTSSVSQKVLENPVTRDAALKTFAQTYATSVAHGTAAMTAITGINIAGERGAELASGQEFDHSNEPSVTSQMVQGAEDAASTFGVMGAFGPAMGLHSDLAQARKAKVSGDFYRAFGDTSEASKLRERLPEAHQELIKGLTQDGPVENIYVPHEAFQSYFQGKNVDPETVANELGIQDSYKEAAQTGGDVKIPLDVWASKVAGTEHYQGLQGDIKFSPDDLTANQVEEKKSEIAEQMKQADDSAGGETPNPSDSAQQVYDQRYQQLTDAGMTPYEARLSATLHESAFRTLGERTGLDPAELAKRFQLEIQKGDETAPAQETSFNQEGKLPGEENKEKAQSTDASEKTDALDTEQKASPLTLDQKNDNGPRGKITFQKERAMIELFKNADRSTFLHESGHYFLEIMHNMASDENAPQSMKDDIKATRDWMGLKEGEDIGVKQHEQFARGFEAYLREGKAPSMALARTFSKFKQWLVQIYRSARGLNVELSPEIRGVMDRMLATDDEISRAHEAVGYQQASGMDIPKSVKPRFDDLAFQAREQAESELMKEQMGELTHERKGFLASERARLTVDAEKQVREQPVYQAIDYIKSQVGERKDITKMAQKFLDGKLKDEDAVHFETAAETQGVFADGKELALNIVNSKTTDQFNKSVQGIVEQGMAQHTDLMNKGNIRDRALELVHNDKRAELLALERNILTDKIKNADQRTEITKRNRTEARIQAQAAKDQAKQILDQKPVRDASNSRVYVTAERNAAVKAAKAIQRGDFEKASDYKQQQMLNHALAAEAMRNRAEVEKNASILQKAASRGNDLKDMPYAFNRQVDQLLERFGVKEKQPEDQANFTQIAKDMQAKGESFDDIANATGQVMDAQSGQFRPEALRDFVSRVNDSYVGLQLPESVISGVGADDYRDLKMADLRDLTSSVKAITEIGKKYDRFLDDFIKIGMKEAAAALRQSIEENVGDRYAENRRLGEKYTDQPLKKMVENIKNIPDAMISTLVNTLTLSKYLDGGADTGPAHDYIYRPLKHAEDRKFARYAKMREEISGENGLFAKFYEPKELADYKKKVTEVSGRDITKENILSMALNWGNEQNRDRIRAGFGERDATGRLSPLSDDTIQGLFKHLSKKDWDFTQAAWDHLQTYWPEISALEMKIKGVEPEGVEPSSFQNEHGAYRGGYYPIAYDFDKSNEAFKSEQQKTELYKQYSAATAQTEQGHAISRASFVARPVRLSLDVFFNHLENVIHDLEFRPAVIDVNKFLNMPDAKNSIQNGVGPDAYRGLDTWLKSIASDQSENLTWYEKALAWSRFGTTISTLGMTPKAFLLHMPSNVFNSMWEIGTQNTVRMMTRAALDVAMGRGELKDFVYSKSERMKQRLTVRDRDIMDMARAWQGTAAGVIPHYAFMSLHLADEAVSIPLWSEVYKNNVADLGEKGAVDLADETVTRTLGSGSKVDQIGAQRGSQTKKLFTMFYSWMSVMFNRAWMDGRMSGLEYSKGNVGSAAAILAKATFFAWALPSVHEALLQQAMYNGKQSDEDRNKQITGKLIEQPFSMIPFVRDIVPPIVHKAFGEHGSDYKMSPVEQAWQNIYTPAADGAHIAFTGKHVDEHYAEEVARGMSQIAGYPQQLNTWAFNLLDYVQGNGEASMKDFLSRRRKH